MYLESLENKLPAQFIKIKYDCNGDEERCGKNWSLKLKDAEKNFAKNNGKHICRQCGLKANNPASRPEVQEKMKKTNLERYGSTCAMNTAEKIAERTEKMFGTQEAIDARTEKTKQTNKERYGAEHIMQTEEGIKRLNEAMQEKYGVDFPLQSEEILENKRQTCQEQYGVDNPAQLPEIQIKMAATTFKKYGVEHYNQLPEMRDYLREHCREWLQENWDNPWSKGIVRPQEWNDKQSATVAALVEMGEWKAGHRNSWHGYYHADKCKRQVSFFRSGFELLYHWHLDHNSQVEWYHYEPFFIRYTKPDGKPGRYFPDFLVKYLGDPCVKLTEVKADYLHDSLATKAKYEAALQYVINETNMQYQILLKQDIDALGLDFAAIRQDKRVTITHNPTKK